MPLQLRIDLFRCDLRRYIEKAQMAIAWKLPKWLVMWATVRCYANATTGDYGGTHPDELGYGELMKRWEVSN